MRKFMCAAIVAVCAVSVALAAEYNGTITKIDGDAVTFTKKGKKGKKGESMTIKLAKDVGVFTTKKDPDNAKKTIKGDALEGGLATLKKRLEDAGEKGVNAQFSTTGEGDAERITEIRVGKGGKKAAGAN